MFRAPKIGLALRRAVPFLLCVVPNFAQLAPNRYTLLLEDPPVASRFATRDEMASPAAVTYRNQIEAKQRTVMNDLSARRIAVTGSTSTLINAIFVTAPASRVSEMLSIPGVAAVRPMHRFKPNLNAATQLMNAPAAWNLVGGQANAGKGIKIAVLDTGIDQTHPAFQDSSLAMPAGFPICDAGNQQACSSFTNNKVIVARSYVRQLAMDNVTNPGNPAAQSQPDDYTPRDRVGHGTAVASAAAGVQNTGTAKAAAGGALTFSGMAPKAYLGNYKIYGSPGVNDFFADDVLIQALGDVMTDGFDIATLSSGSLALTGATNTGAACGLPAGQQCDPLAAAFEAAAQKGLVITVAVGNAGSDAFNCCNENYPYFNSISTPATAPSVIGVGATINSHALTSGVSVNNPSAPSNLKGIAAQLDSEAAFQNSGCNLGNGLCPPTSGAIQAPLIDVSQLGNDGYACAALPAGSLNGAFALIERGNCQFSTKETNAQTAGAVGVVFYMADSSAPIPPEGTCAFLGPAVMISNADGVNLKNYIDANSGQIVTIDNAGVETPLATYNQFLAELGITPPLVQNQLASFSSFGPTPDGLIKPDLVATGALDVVVGVETNSGVYLAAQNFDPNGFLYSTNRYGAADGTSFATPLVAGAAALVKQAHPNYTAAQIKSALVNFAAQDTTTDDTGNTVTAEWLGAGRLDAGAAANASVGLQPATVSFGYLQTGTSLPITKPLTVTNPGSAAVTLTVSVVSSNPATGASVTADKTSLPVPAGGSATLNVTLSGSVPSAGAYSGQVTLQASGVSLVVPYLFLAASGVAYNVVPYVGGEGVPGQDIGASFVHVIDQYGVPVVGTPVTFSASSGTMVFNSVQGEPSCSGNGTSSAVCNTDNFGFAYTDIVLGSRTGTPVINVKAAGLALTGGATTLPAPAITTGSANCFGVPAAQGDVCNAASFQSPISPGSYASIFGSNLVDSANLVNASGCDESVASPYFPLVLDGVNVSFDVPGSNISVPAPIVVVCSGQINFLVPWELSGQTSAQVKVIIDEEFGTPIYGNVVTAAVANYAPAFFTSCNNFACAQDVNYNLITSSHPAVPGQIIQLYANGLGPVNNQPADGYPAPLNANQTTMQPCSVSIGGQPATVEFCGLAPGEVIYQANVQVPTNIGSGNQPITITVGGQTSPSGVMIPVQ